MKLSTFSRFIASIICLIFLTLPTFSQLRDTVALADTIKTANQLDEVTISTTRANIKRSKLPQSVTLISKADIALTPSVDFTDLLKKNAAVNVIQYPSLLSGVGMRGFKAQQGDFNQRILMLVDGRPSGTANLATIHPADVERIEILKGPASALYGSQAMGGVVNIITRKSVGAVRSNVSVEYGSFETLRVAGASGGSITPNLDYDVSFNFYNRSKDVKLGRGNFFRDLLGAETALRIYPDFSETEVDDRRSDGLKRDFTRLSYNSASLRMGYKLSANWRVDVRGERFVAENIESPSDLFYQNARPSGKDINKHNAELSVSGKLANHQLFVRGYVTNEDNFNRDLQVGGVPIVPYVSFTSGANWNGIQVKDVYSFGSHSVTAGVDFNSAVKASRSFNNDRSEKAPFSPNYELQSVAGYAQAQLNFVDGKLVVNPGVRYDVITYNVKQTLYLNTYAPGKETNPFFSPSLSAQYTFLDFTPHATIGRAFVNPDAYNVAGYSELVRNNAASITVGNAGLRNESSTSWDAGVRYVKSKLGLNVDVTYFSTFVKDRITSQNTKITTGEKTESGYVIADRTTYVNASKAEISGLEAAASVDVGQLLAKRYSLRVFADAARNFRTREVLVSATGLETYRPIFNVPNFTSSYGLEYGTRKGLTLRLTGRYVGNRKDFDFTDTKRPIIVYPSFMTMDFATSFTYAKRHTISLMAENLTDENYYEKRGFNLQGRNFSLRYGVNF